MSRFRSAEHRQQRQILICYKIKRRSGFGRQRALEEAVKMHVRLTGAFASLKASGYTADPIELARTANSVQL